MPTLMPALGLGSEKLGWRQTTSICAYAAAAYPHLLALM